MEKEYLVLLEALAGRRGTLPAKASSPVRLDTNYHFNPRLNHQARLSPKRPFTAQGLFGDVG